jgi:hypothetical protein
VKTIITSKSILVLLFFVSSQSWLINQACAADSTPVADTVFEAAAKALEKSKEEVQRLKDLWDKTRLETTLYDQRAKRAFQRWVKSKTKAREQAKAAKEKAELELQLAIEKRKLAYNQWQAAMLRQLSKESEVKALDQDKDTKAIRDQIKKLQDKLTSPAAPAAPSH